jgi:putative flippase GtrA
MMLFVRFLLVGLLNTVFGVGCYCALVFVGLNYKLATLLSTIMGVLWNFKTTSVLVFNNRDNGRIFRFVGCYAVIYLVNIGLIRLFKMQGLNDYWGGILAVPFVAIASFFLLKKIVYEV